MRAASSLLLLIAGACSRGPAVAPSDLATATARDPRCPGTAPAMDDLCDPAGGGELDCEYGGDAFSRNTTLAECFTGAGKTMPTWSVFNLAVPPNPTACPGTWAAALQGASCASDVNLACDYDEGRCACVCFNTTVLWDCRNRDFFDLGNATPLDYSFYFFDACPTRRPLAGDACPHEGSVCYYDEVCGVRPLSFGPALMCTNGYWEITVDTGAACGPIHCAGWTG